MGSQAIDIGRQDVLNEVEPLAEHFTQKGYQIFLVGGIVRDLELGNPVAANADIDLCTDARPAQIKKVLKNFVQSLWLAGERFGTVGCIYKERVYEITTFRSEVYAADTRKPKVSFGDDILKDLQRRDFTVNAMAISLPDGELVDPHKGRQDLQAKILRTPLRPQILFQEDPLRMLRAARFESQLGFVPDKDLVQAMEELCDRLDIVSKERQTDELKRILAPDKSVDRDYNPALGLKRLKQTGLLKKLIPNPTDSAPTDSAIDALKEFPPDFGVRLAVLLLEGFVNSPNFEKENIQALLKTSLKNLRPTRSDIKTISQLLGIVKSAVEMGGRGVDSSVDSSAEDNGVDSSMDKGESSAEEPNRNFASCIRILADKAESKDVFLQSIDLLELHSPQLSKELTQALNELAASEPDLFEPRSQLSSGEIMEILGIPPGPEVGKAQILLKQAYYEKGRLTKREAKKLLKKRLL